MVNTASSLAKNPTGRYETRLQVEKLGLRICWIAAKHLIVLDLHPEGPRRAGLPWFPGGFLVPPWWLPSSAFEWLGPHDPLRPEEETSEAKGRVPLDRAHAACAETENRLTGAALLLREALAMGVRKCVGTV